MPPENDTTNPAASQETPAQAGAGNQANAAATTSPETTLPAASPETPAGKTWAGKYQSPEDMEKGYFELLRYLSQKADPEALRNALGLWQPEDPKQTPANPQQTAPQVPQQPAPPIAAQRAQQNTGTYAQAVSNLRAQGWTAEDAIAYVAAYVAEQNAGRVAEVKVQEMLEARMRPAMEAMARQYAETIERTWKTDLQTAWTNLVADYPDADTPQAMQAINAHLSAKSRPRFKAILEDPSSTVQDRVEVLRTAYFATQNQTRAEVADQAKAAGAKQEQKRQQSVAAAQVESGGAGGPTPTDTEDPTLARAKAIQQSILGAGSVL